MRPYSALVGLEEAVALHVLVDSLLGLPGVQRVDLVDPLRGLEDLSRVDLDVGRLPLEAGRRLWISMRLLGQRHALASRAAHQQQRAHRHRDPEHIVDTSGFLKMNCIVS